MKEAKIYTFWGIFDYWKNLPWANGSGSESTGSRIQFFGSVTALDFDDMHYSGDISRQSHRTAMGSRKVNCSRAYEHKKVHGLSTCQC